MHLDPIFGSNNSDDDDGGKTTVVECLYRRRRSRLNRGSRTAERRPTAPPALPAIVAPRGISA